MKNYRIRMRHTGILVTRNGGDFEQKGRGKIVAVIIDIEREEDLG